MDANQMADELELKLDRLSSLGSPGYEDFEISSVLSEAEMLYVKKFLDRKNNRKQESFEETEIRGQGLSGLVKRENSLPVSASQEYPLQHGVFFDLPEDFMYTIHEEVEINKNVCGTEEPIIGDVRVVQYNDTSRLRKNKYKKPFCKPYGDALVWRLVYSRENDGHENLGDRTVKRHQLITDGTFEIANYSINYLMLPKGIVVDRDDPTNQRNSVLDDSTHTIIVDLAASIMSDRVKEQELNNSIPIKEVE
jgi:hypothetical protein